MRAITVDAFGGPDQLALRELPSAPLEPGHVRVELRAIGVNRADILLRSGAYHGATTPARPGLEAAGVVTEAAPGARVQPGARVVIFGDRSGLYASEATPAEGALAAVPDGVSLADAAALPINGLTAWYCLERLIRVEPGETVLVLAAASGVGTLAVQLAARRGARVIAAAGSPAKLDLARALGASDGIDYEREDLVERALALTEGRGVDGVVDAIGGRRFAEALRALAPFGRVAALANVTLEPSVINTRDFYPKNASIHGFQLGRLLASGRWDPRPAMDELLALAARAQLRPVIDRTYRLDEAPEAHRRLESRASLGKVLLVP